MVPTTLTAFSLLLIALGGYLYNDIMDAEMDRLNPEKKGRPIPSGKALKKHAMHLVYFTVSVGIFLSLFVKPRFCLSCLILLTLFWAYSNHKMYFKKKTLVKEGFPSIGYFICVISGALIGGSISITVIFAGIFSALFIFFGLPAFRDTPDVEVDKMFGIKSLATILPWKQRLEMVILFILAIMTLTPLTYMNFGFNVIFPIVVVAMGFLVLRYLFPLLNRLEQTQYKKALKYMTSYFFLSQFSMVLASIFMFP